MTARPNILTGFVSVIAEKLCPFTAAVLQEERACRVGVEAPNSKEPHIQLTVNTVLRFTKCITVCWAGVIAKNISIINGITKKESLCATSGVVVSRRSVNGRCKADINTVLQSTELTTAKVTALKIADELHQKNRLRTEQQI